jgi:hypothetical protein
MVECPLLGAKRTLFAQGYELRLRNVEMEKPPACDRGLSVHFRPNTHVAAFSRSMTSNEATQNASAVPATIRMYVMVHLPP